jgi:hypothetical protein
MRHGEKQARGAARATRWGGDESGEGSGGAGERQKGRAATPVGSREPDARGRGPEPREDTLMGSLRKRGSIWQLRYYRGGHLHEVSSGTDNKVTAQRLLDRRVGAVASGKRITPKMDRLTFDEAAADLVNDYRMNDRRSLDEVERRIQLHLEPYFGGWRLAQISAADVRDYVVQRQGQTEIVRRAHDVKRKDGTVRHVPEQRRRIARVSTRRSIANSRS